MEQQQPGYQSLMANQAQPYYNNGSQPQQGMQYQNMSPNMYSQNRGSGLQRLESLGGIFVKKQLELAEVLLGCETKNRYHVYGLDETGKKREPMHFKCKENSGFCERQCLAGSCRPFQMDVSTVQFNGGDALEPFLSLNRPCKCTCYCLARPELTVNLVEGGQNTYLGKVVEPFTCCNMEQHVYGQDGAHKYTIVGDCSQLGFWCRGFPCDACQTIDFEIRSASGEQVGQIQKRSQGCLKAAVSDTDIFTINYPQTCTANDKALLMSAVLFLDYNYFEKNPNEKK